MILQIEKRSFCALDMIISNMFEPWVCLREPFWFLRTTRVHTEERMWSKIGTTVRPTMVFAHQFVFWFEEVG